jgi:hypothetical protein
VLVWQEEELRSAGQGLQVEVLAVDRGLRYSRKEQARITMSVKTNLVMHGVQGKVYGIGRG